MRLVRRESVDDPQEGSEEYKHAIKSVIRCQIQSLLQKLASETGDETIVISTNVTAGTYTHFGSCMGQEYLDNKDGFVQTLSLGFSDFCAEKQTQGIIIAGVTSLSESSNAVSLLSDSLRSTLPAPRKKTPRKRPLTPNYEPASKRKPTPYSSEITARSPHSLPSSQSTSPAKGSNSSQLEGNNSSQLFENHSSQNGHEIKKIYVSNIPYIKTEPVDDYTPMTPNGSTLLTVNGDSPDSMTSHDTDISHGDDSTKNSIINRPTSLIPLANIFKKYGSKPVKNERVNTPESIPEIQENEDSLPSEKSILRSLYEQPLYGLDDYVGVASDSEKDCQVAMNLPQTLTEDIEKYPPATENLVLSGYYDSDNYPLYRHNKKHPANSNSKKSKSKEKNSSGNTSSTSPSYIDNLVSPGGTDLKMKMFESNGRLVYACDVCKRELSHLTSYRRHMKLHTMDRPHKCPVCSKGFIRKYHCIDHVNKHHKDVDFNPETLMLRGSSKSLDDTTAFSESLSISPGEYNYTLDQSIEDTDQSMNTSIDQSASNMLSELAKSAQKAQLMNQSALEIADVSAPDEILNTPTDCENFDYSEGEKTNSLEAEDDKTENINSSEINYTEENGSESALNQPIRSSPVKPEKSSLARKYEVTEGIKAIVAHLKSSSRKKKMMAEAEVPADPVKLTNEEI